MRLVSLFGSSLLALCCAAPLVAALTPGEAQACIHAMRNDPDMIGAVPSGDVAERVAEAQRYAEQGASSLALRTLARAYPELTKLDSSYKKPNKIKVGKRANHSAERYTQAATLAATVIARDGGQHALSSRGESLKAASARQRQLAWAVKVLQHATKAAPQDVALQNALADAMLAHPKHKKAGEKLATQLQAAGTRKVSPVIEAEIEAQQAEPSSAEVERGGLISPIGTRS